MGSREKIPKTMLWHSIYGVLPTPWWMIQSVWGSSYEFWLVLLSSGTLSFHNIHLWTSTHRQQFFLLIPSYPSITKLVGIFWHHFSKKLPHIYQIMSMSGRDNKGLLYLLSQILIVLWNPCFLPFLVMWLWVVLSLKSEISAALSI